MNISENPDGAKASVSKTGNRLLAVAILVLPLLVGRPALTEDLNAAPARSTLQIEESLESEILRLTNEHRRKAGLKKLATNVKMRKAGRRHGHNMIRERFFSHKDHKGRDPMARMREWFPELFGGFGENLALLQGEANAALAKEMMAAWMRSPGHRKNILRPTFDHIGVAVILAPEGRAYGVQIFGTLDAELIGPPPKQVAYGAQIKLRFRFLGDYPKEKITIFIKFADPQALFELPDKRAYRGVAPLTPLWQENEFELGFVCDKGRGTYEVLFGRGGSVVKKGGLQFVVR